MHPLVRVPAVLAAFVVVAQGQLTREANTTLTFPTSLPTGTGYNTENALGTLTFSAPMCTAVVPGETNRLFVAERGGTIQAVTNLTTTPAKTLYLSVSSLLITGQTATTDGENGLISIAFHPNYATNGTLFLYFSFTQSSVRYQRLHKVVVSNPAANTATISSHTGLLTIRDRETNHNGGSLHFGADGYLYLSLGDEGAGGDSRNNARFINHQLDPVGTTNRVERTGFWGQMLRLDVDNKPENLAPNPHVQNSAVFPSAVNVGTYKVPADNPFIGYTQWHSVAIDPATVRTEIYATGLRNPFRFTFDPPTGRLFLGDVGQSAREEIDIITKGGDYGWSWREGNIAYSNPPAPTTPPAPANPGDPPGTGFNRVDPIFDYVRTNSGSNVWGTSVTGGMVMRGNRLPELFGAYIFADFNSGQIVALRQSGATWTSQILTPTSGLLQTGIVNFGIDPRNADILMCDLTDNIVRRLVRATTTGTNPPATLSAAGIFSNLATLTPNTGIVPYEPNVGFWSDYGIKSRWFSIKNLTDTIGFSANGSWTFPAGMVWIKHFDFETTRGNPQTRRKLETRVLVKTATDIYGLTYKWNAAQTDADIVPEEGLTELIPSSSPAQNWRYPSRSECRACHSTVGGFALSFNTRQMNREHIYGAATQNQIAALSGAGYFATPVQGLNGLPAFPPLTEDTKSLESRVRAYLAVNCSQCHQPNGNATGNWDARPTTATDAANLINGVLVNTFGDNANRFAVPGDVAHSMVLKRIQGAGVPRMPPFGTFERDVEAEELLTDWIMEELPGRQSLVEWQTAHFGSPTAPEAAPGLDPDLDGQTNALEFLQRTPPLTIGLPVLPAVSLEPATIGISFVHPANRSALVETSTDLLNWSLWDVPDNFPQFPASDTPRVLIGPRQGPQRHYRVRFGEQ